MAAKGRLDRAEAEEAIGRIASAADLADLAGAALVIEAVVENVTVKQTLFAALEEVLAPDALLATNTSSLSVTELAAGLAHPGRFLGLHFFNPAPCSRSSRWSAVSRPTRPPPSARTAPCWAGGRRRSAAPTPPVSS